VESGESESVQISLVNDLLNNCGGPLSRLSQSPISASRDGLTLAPEANFSATVDALAALLDAFTRGGNTDVLSVANAGFRFVKVRAPPWSCGGLAGGLPSLICSFRTRVTQSTLLEAVRL
jgi:hypothetical protein